MTACANSCHGAAACRQHLDALLRLHGAGERVELDVRDSLDTLLPLAPSDGPRDELDLVAERLRERVSISPQGALDPNAFLREPEVPAHPLLAGVLAVTAARGEGVAVGLLADQRGRVAVAHAALAEPVVIELAPGYPVVDVTGSETGWRWVCAHQLAALTGLELPVVSG